MKALRWLTTALAIVALAVFVAPAASLAQEHGEAQEHAEEQEHAGEQEHAEAAADEHAAEDDHGEAAAHGADDGHGEAGAHGAEGEHHDDEHHVAVPTTTEYIYKWINFVLLLGLLYFLLVVPPAFVKDNFEFDGLKAILSERSKAIVAARDLAREQTQQAESGLEESASRLAQIEEESAGLVAQAREDAERDKARMIDEAGAVAESIRAGANRDMQGEVTRAARDLKAHVAHLSIGIATDLVKKNFSSSDQDRLVREYLDRLGESVS